MKKVTVLIVSIVLQFTASYASVINFISANKITSASIRNIFQETYILFKDGKVYKVENGEPKELQKEIQLNNGTIVYPNGTYELKDKKQYSLSDGECLDMNGSHYLNQKMVIQKRPMSADELQKSRNQNWDKVGKGKSKQ